MSRVRILGWCKRISEERDETEFYSRTESRKSEKSAMELSMAYYHNNFRRTELQHGKFALNLKMNVCAIRIHTNPTDDQVQRRMWLEEWLNGGNTEDVSYVFQHDAQTVWKRMQ
jgi:hypothetical protein